MAWPCISRVCCLARFWSQLDKSDLVVPLTLSNYSDRREQDAPGSVTTHLPTDRTLQICCPAPDHRRPLSVRDPAEAKRRNTDQLNDDDQPPSVPQPRLSLYRQDFKPWPIPRRQIVSTVTEGKTGLSGEYYPNTTQKRAEKLDRRRGKPREPRAEVFITSSYRQDYQDWTGPNQQRPTEQKHTFRVDGANLPVIPMVTSYRAAFSRDSPKVVETPKVERLRPQQTGIRLEGQPVRTQRPSNPSAIFQSGSQICSL